MQKTKKSTGGTLYVKIETPEVLLNIDTILMGTTGITKNLGFKFKA